MIDTDYLDENILNDILENTDDASMLSREEAMDKYLIYNGIQGYTTMIIEAIDNLTVCQLRAQLKSIVESDDPIDYQAASVRSLLLTEGHRNDSSLVVISEAMHHNDGYLINRVRELT